MVNFKPIGSKIFIESIQEDNVTPAGIILTPTNKEKPNKGIIVAVGPGTKEEEITVKVGDKIVHIKNAGIPINIEGKDYLIIRQSDIMAII